MTDTEAQPFYWDYKKDPFLFVYGPAGTGKTVSLKQLARQFDFGGGPSAIVVGNAREEESWREVAGPLSVFIGEPCNDLDSKVEAVELLELMERTAKGRILNGITYPKLLLIVDELAMLTTDSGNSYDLGRGLGAQFKKLVRSLRDLIAGTGIHMAVSSQRPDSAHLNQISKGAVLALGPKLGRTPMHMIFGDETKVKMPGGRHGTGLFKPTGEDGKIVAVSLLEEEEV